MDLLKSATISCPYCGESMAVDVDCSVPQQSYIEDCQICCRPISILVSVDDNLDATVLALHEDESFT